ncbi:MAG TPA: Gmad2 immunoglobulin-like domain-containing protein [Jiangellaceae bacterium]|nr:Gmad2 immunoglobulin-like domain-containing protein [Jiangellaceae bacterium]
MSVDDERFRRDEELLRQALREEADGVLPSIDALSRIRRRTARPPLWRRPVVLGVAAASVTAMAVIAGSAYFLGDPADDTTASGSDSSPSAVDSPTAAQSPSPSVTESPTPPESTETTPPETDGPGSGGLDTVPVYYVTDTTQGPRLAREFREVPAPDGPLVAAVTTMLAEPALDFDYESLWLPDTQVRGVEVTANAIEVDFTGETDYTAVRDDVAELAVQQLVYTVTAAANDAGLNGQLPVQIMVDGEQPGQMWGQLDLTEPIAREPQTNVGQLVQIDNPFDRAVVGRTVTVRGVAMAFEATLTWQVYDDEGNPVEEGFTNTNDSGRFAPFEFEVELEPGVYSVVVTDSDPTGGAEGPGPMSDTKNFTVE